MRKRYQILVALALSVGAISSASAHDSFSFGLNIGQPYYAPPVRYYAPPVTYYQPAPRAYYGPPLWSIMSNLVRTIEKVGVVAVGVAVTANMSIVSIAVVGAVVAGGMATATNCLS